MALPPLGDVQAMLDASPFNAWLGLRVTDLTEDAVTLILDTRPEMLSNTEQPMVHGGIIGSVLDAAGDFALVGRLGHPVPTVDLQVNFLRAAPIGRLLVRGRVVKVGRQLAVADAELLDEGGRLLAVSRGTYFAGGAA